VKNRCARRARGRPSASARARAAGRRGRPTPPRPPCARARTRRQRHRERARVGLARPSSAVVPGAKCSCAHVTTPATRPRAPSTPPTGA
jgi:hypothetical protein